MMTRRFLPFVVLMAAAIAVVAVTEASATTLNLDTGKSLSVAPGASGTFTFSATNDAGDISNNFEGWQLAIQILPNGATTGTLLPNASGLSIAATNPMPTSAFGYTQPGASQSTLTGGASINGSTSYWRIGIVAGTTQSVLGNTSYNLGDLTLEASGSAAGLWDVFAVTQSSELSYWDDLSANTNDFGNLPRGANRSVLLGTVTVTPVPEPSTAGMLVVALGAAGLVVRNRRSRKAIEPAKADVLGESGSRCIGA